MKNIVKYFALVCVALGMASCVQDLNTTPIDPNSSTSFNQERMFTKCYSCLAVVGQGDPKEDTDVRGLDVDCGTSGFYRTIWYCNELSTDEAWWIWDDKESKELCQTNWSGDNTMIRAIYTRLNLDMMFCNHYLRYASSETQEDQYRLAEVRFIRALHIFYLLDLYLYAPLIIEEFDQADEFPHYLPRHEIYKWLVDELKDLIEKLPPVRLSKYRVGKSAAQLLLARVYLNADVYNKYNPDWTANETWQKAYDAATETINDNKGIHELVTDSVSPDSSMVYSAYQRLFMGDNHNDDVIKESILQIYQDGLYAQSYAGSVMMIAANRIKGMNAWGVEQEWHSMRTSPTMVDKFLKPMKIDRHTAEEMVYDEFDMPKKLHDDRAILCSHGLNTGYKFALKGNQDLGKDEYLFDCWAGLKFTGVYSGYLPQNTPRQSTEWPDTDIPLLRLAEAYMIQAEALFRMGDVEGARTIINQTIRARAHADELPELTDEILLDEWSREFWYEGRRRIDLVRFGRFFGPEADMHYYHWEGRMGKADNMPFTSKTPEYMNWFPVPSEDKRLNPNYKTDVEGDPNNIYANEGGDGYTY